jgi:tRNA C32,U32 (ribose-2'-O)-methylase TrmJ
MEVCTVDILALIVSVLGSNGVLLFLVKRYFDRKDKREEGEKKAREQAEQQREDEIKALLRKVDTGLETIRLLSYARMSEELERLLTQGYATPAERRTLKEMYENYKAHGWNGDMDARLQKVYTLRTNPPTG